VLTIFFVIFLSIHVSYTATKYSDFGKNGFFQISRGMDQQLCYNKFMTEKEYDGPMCCAGCTCTASHSSTPAPEAI
jgi:hypothetical protein